MKFSEPKRRKEAICGRRTDRISRLPDDLIYKILSFISIHDAIRTSSLSRRWRYLWTSIPYLNFLNENYCHGFHFSDFVDNALSRLDNQLQVSSFKLFDNSPFSHDFVKRIVNFAASHNVQRLTIISRRGSVFPATWELPALTNLHLHRITLSASDPKCVDLISKCTNLKNLTLTEFRTVEVTQVLHISHPRLSTLTFEDTYGFVRVVNLVTPQLKSLTVSCCSTNAKHMISAPKLTSLVLSGWHPLQISTEGFPSLKKVELRIAVADLTVAPEMVFLFQQLHTVKFLKTNLQVLEILSSSQELISHQPCAFPNLKISKFIPNRRRGIVYMEAQEKVVTMTTELKSQDTSPSAIVSHEEIQVMRKLVSAKVLVTNLSWKGGSCKRKRGKVQVQGKVQVKKQCVQSEFEMQWHFGEMMAQIEQEEIDGILAYNFPILETREMISSLQCIAGLLTELPASKRSVLQVAFTSLCEEAAILMNTTVMDKQSSRARKPKSRARKPKAHPKERK